MSDFFNRGAYDEYRATKNYRYRPVGPPTDDNPLVTVNEFKSWGKVRGSQKDLVILDLLKMVLELAENYTRLTFREQIFDTFRDSFYWTGGQRLLIELERSPFVSLQTVEYNNEAGVLTVVDPSIYYTEDLIPYARVRPQEQQVWPTDVRRQNQSIRINFIAGYGPGCQLPITLKIGMMQHALDILENKLGDCSCTATGLCCEAHSISYGSFRIYTQG